MDEDSFNRTEEPYECPPFAMPADLFYIAIGFGVLLVLALMAIKASS